MRKKQQEQGKKLAIVTRSWVFAYGGGPKGPYAGPVTLLFLAGILIAYPEAVFNIKILFDESANDAQLEKRKSVMRKVGYAIAILGLVWLVWTIYERLN